MTDHLLQLSGIIVDLIYEVEKVPLAGEEAIVNDLYMSAGGGFNAMVAARRAQMPATYGGSLGQGPLADMVRQQLCKEDISTLQVTQGARDQGCCTVLVDASGERTFIAKEGAEGTVSTEQLAQINPTRFNWVLVSGYTLVYKQSRDAVAEWIDQLPSSSKLVFDPCPLVASIPKPLLHKVMNKCSWLSCNMLEARHLSDTTDAAAAATQLLNSQPNLTGVVVRQGELGCVLATSSDNPLTIPGYPVSAIDTNGAGDAHIGTFIATLAGGAEPEAACTIANAAAALSTTFKGPATTPPLPDVQAYISRFASDNDIESTQPH
ncbi:MAG: hypothetical protein KTR32_43005 [Granulosicoccus sp.]|nr:hypothetical protein [Granulosicoccus sp.]